MREDEITDLEQNQRLDKFLKRHLRLAPSSFVYKMLRKKNITLNGKKAVGKELLTSGDRVRLFLSEETLEKMGDAPQTPAPSEKAGDARKGTRKEVMRYPMQEQTDPRIAEGLEAFRKWKLQVLYEDAHIAAVYKPAGLLCQKGEAGDRSLNEWFLGYLAAHNAISDDALRRFVPSVQNRLDRNTEGIVLLAKTLPGSQLLTGLQREHRIRKFYHMVVKGCVESQGVIEGYLRKEPGSNTVKFSDRMCPGASYTRTEYRPLLHSADGRYTLLEAQLLTGKTHQLRAHLSFAGHPIVGDPKYGDPDCNRRGRALGIRRQLLLCKRVEFPELSGEFAALSGRVISCRNGYEEIMTKISGSGYGNMEFAGAERFPSGRGNQPHQ